MEIEYELDRSVTYPWTPAIATVVSYLAEKLNTWAPDSFIEVQGEAAGESIVLAITLHYGACYTCEFVFLPEYQMHSEDQLRRLGRYWALSFIADLDQVFLICHNEQQAYQTRRQAAPKKNYPAFEW